MAKKGRPNKYETHVKPRLKEIEELCLTMTEKQIAQYLGVGYTSWKQYKLEYPALVACLKKGRGRLVCELRSALIQKAKGYDYVETKEITEQIKWPKEMLEKLVKAGFTKEQIESGRLVKIEVTHKHAHPDVAALNLALKNYDKDNWANDPQTLALREKELALRERQVEANEW